MNSRKFSTHHDLVSRKDLPPSQALLEGMKHCPVPGAAADLGCGAGTDTLYLMSQGWKVLAVDSDKDALDLLKSDVLETSYQYFESLTLPPVQLVNASFALPFCAPAHFKVCWSTIHEALTPNGIFCGHFFGIRDSWASRTDITIHTSEQFEQLFIGFELLWKLETEKDGKTLGGVPKHWHVYHVAARKV